MKLSLLPDSKAGIGSLVMFLILILCLAFFFIMISVFNQRGGATFFSNLTLTIPMLLAWASGVTSFILGMKSLSKDSHKSFLVIIVTVLTLLTSLFGIMQVIG
jgi:hypothetical protein